VGNTLILNNQPAGTYTLTATDQDQCSASHGPFNIPLVNPPAPPAAVSPVEYCQASTSVALIATGSDILWYTGATGGTGSTTAPIPNTSAVGSTSYFASRQHLILRQPNHQRLRKRPKRNCGQHNRLTRCWIWFNQPNRLLALLCYFSKS